MSQLFQLPPVPLSAPGVTALISVTRAEAMIYGAFSHCEAMTLTFLTCVEATTVMAGKFPRLCRAIFM